MSFRNSYSDQFCKCYYLQFLSHYLEKKNHVFKFNLARTFYLDWLTGDGGRGVRLATGAAPGDRLDTTHQCFNLNQLKYKF